MRNDDSTSDYQKDKNNDYDSTTITRPQNAPIWKYITGPFTHLKNSCSYWSSNAISVNFSSSQFPLKIKIKFSFINSLGKIAFFGDQCRFCSSSLTYIKIFLAFQNFIFFLLIPVMVYSAKNHKKFNIIFLLLACHGFKYVCQRLNMAWNLAKFTYAFGNLSFRIQFMCIL